MDFSKCYQGGMENSSVCRGNIKGEGSIGPYSAPMGQENCKILMFQWLGIPIQSTDISWKARGRFKPSSGKVLPWQYISIKRLTVEEICRSNIKIKDVKVFPVPMYLF